MSEEPVPTPAPAPTSIPISNVEVGPKRSPIPSEVTAKKIPKKKKAPVIIHQASGAGIYYAITAIAILTGLSIFRNTITDLLLGARGSGNAGKNTTVPVPEPFQSSGRRVAKSTFDTTQGVTPNAHNLREPQVEKVTSFGF